MSVTFYNISGGMVGIDPHTFVAAPNVTIKWVYPHVVVGVFATLTATIYKRTETVTADGMPMLQGGFDLYLVPHVPAPILPPGPLEAVEFSKIMIMSGSKAQMSVHSVTGRKEALATCLSGCVGLNVNCAEPFDLPIGMVFNPSSVMTTPTSGDYIGALVGYAVDVLIGTVISGGMEQSGMPFPAEAFIKHVLRRLPDILKAIGLDTPAAVSDPGGQAQELAQQICDGEFGP
jgi:hypothetical protein